MKFLKVVFVITTIVTFYSCKSDKKESAQAEEILIQPIQHGTFVLKSNSTSIFVDPVGGVEKFNGMGTPNYVLITDIHGDHLQINTLQDLNLKNTTLIAPKAVADKLPQGIAKSVVILNNGDTYESEILKVEAIPMYNLREEALKFHPKGRGNGYVVSISDKRIYVSGDTEDIQEMRNLDDIDIAFVCMNLPYTMTESSAASAVLDFKPKKVYPYHYRGKNGLSNVEAFKNEVYTKNEDIEIVLLNWYN